jgi:hypothetical protein
MRVGEYTIRVYFHDHAPAHVHVIHGTDEIRVTLADLSTSTVKGQMNVSNTRRAVAAVKANRTALRTLWKEAQK